MSAESQSIPANWISCRLSELLLPVLKIDTKAFIDRIIKYIDISSIDNNRNQIGETKLLPLKEAPSRAKQIVQTGDVLFSLVRPYLKNIAFVDTHLNGEVASTGFSILRTAKGFNWKYLYYLVISSNFVNAISGKQYGVSYPAVKDEQIKSQLINLPPLNEQHRIVAKIEELFSELDNGITALKTAREQLKVYRQAVLKHAFEGKLTAKWREENADKLETPEQLLARTQQEREARYQQQLAEWEHAIKDGEAKGKGWKKPGKPKPYGAMSEIPSEMLIGLSSIPNNWIYVKAEYLCEFITKGTTPPKEELYSGSGEIPFIKVYNLTKAGHLDFSIEPTFISDHTHKNFLTRSKVIPGDVLMNIVGPPLGKVSIVPSTFSEWNINQAIAFYRSPLLLNKYTAEYLLFENTVRYMMKKSKATAGQFNLTLEICRDLPVPFCSKKEQEEIVKLLEHKLSIVDANELEIQGTIQRAETLRQSILKKAFSGQLVPQDPSDEPANELLARIQAEKIASQQSKDTKPKTSKRKLVNERK